MTSDEAVRMIDSIEASEGLLWPEEPVHRYGMISCLGAAAILVREFALYDPLAFDILPAPLGQSARNEFWRGRSYQLFCADGGRVYARYRVLPKRTPRN